MSEHWHEVQPGHVQTPLTPLGSQVPIWQPTVIPPKRQVGPNVYVPVVVVTLDVVVVVVPPPVVVVVVLVVVVVVGHAGEQVEPSHWIVPPQALQEFP